MCVCVVCSYFSSAYCILYQFQGAIDGKHIVVQAPINSGSSYYNYKGQHCYYFDILYRFTVIDVGDLGRHSDGGVLAHSSFGIALENDSLSFPAPHPLPGTAHPKLPFVIVGD